jgi:uncharacterized membrane protein
MDVTDLLLLASVVATGLIAGLFYGWVVSVIPGTKRLDHVEYVRLMQHINREILRPRFLLLFMGVPFLLVAAGIAQLRSGDQRRGVLVLGSAVTYSVGVFGVTAARNVPLNDALDEFDLANADDADVEARRQSYETRWNRWNAVRSAANLVAFALVAAAAVLAESDG